MGLTRFHALLKKLCGASCVIAALMVPATASAYDLQYSNGKPVRWAYSGRKVVWFQLNQSYGPYGTAAAIANGMSTWNNVSGAALVFGINKYSASHQHGTMDGVNLIDFYPMSDRNVIAENFYWYWSESACLIDSDIRFNLYNPFATDGNAASYDLQTIATHELGHSIFLADLYGFSDTNKMMYGYGTKGQIKRQLDTDDKDGIIYLYSSAYVNFACLYAYYADCYAAAANNGSGNARQAANFSHAAYYWANLALSTLDASCSYYAWLCGYYASLYSLASYRETGNAWSSAAYYYGQLGANYSYANYQGY